MGDVVERARAAAEAALADLPRRWAHVQGVAARAAGAAAVLDPVNADEIVAACWLHDIGYSASAQATGFHPVDGARFVAGLGFSPLVVSLVAHHTGASFEADERGLSDELAAFAAPPAAVLDVVTWADLTTSVDGSPVDVGERVREILARYPVEDPVYRAVSRSVWVLLASVKSVQARLAVAAGGA